MPDHADADLLDALAAKFMALPEVHAVCLGGSAVTNLPEAATSPDAPPSDLDVCVVVSGQVDPSERLRIINELGGASRLDHALDYFGDYDEWIHTPTGRHMDVVFWDREFLTGYLHRILDEHQPQLGYTTAHWHTLRNWQIIADDGTAAQISRDAARDYPDALARAIVDYNYPLLTHNISSFGSQIVKAHHRGDIISLNHRTAEFLASWSDIVFAANRIPHPGEKRILDHMPNRCDSLPDSVDDDVESLLDSVSPSSSSEPKNAIESLMNHLDEWLAREMPRG